jgi:hypothetical protein
MRRAKKTLSTATDCAAMLTVFASSLASVIILLEFRHMDKHKNLKISMKLFNLLIMAPKS